MLAKDLDQVYINFDPTRPLPGISEFYVNRENNPLDEMKRALLRDSFIPPKLLFSGHRGSGKSTELNRLMADQKMQEKYFIVHYSIMEVLDTAGLDYTDLLVSIGAQIFIKANDIKLELKDKLLNELYRWKETIEKEIDKGWVVGGEVGSSAGLSSFLTQVLAKLKLEFTNRQKIRQVVEQRLSELVGIIDLIITEVEIESNKKVLVAIDGLDKPDLKVVHTIFYERQPSLTQPKCSIIYTVPVALYYSQEFGQVKHAFTESYVLPNVSIAKYDDGSPYEEGRKVMRNFVEKRMSLDLIEKDALEYAISISGGVFREMAWIIRTAADKAIARGDEKIQKSDIDKAESRRRNEFRRILRTEDYDLLVNIHRNRKLMGAEKCAHLLHNLSILEYVNDENWCDVHPVIIPLIEGEKP